MSNNSVQQFKPISLKTKKYFKLKIGTRVLVKDMHGNKKTKVFGTISLFKKGKQKIPLYSTNPLEVYGYVSKSNIKNFKKPYLLWGIDGDFNLRVMPKGTKFATTDHCGCIQIKDSKILPEYLLLDISKKGEELGFDRSFRASIDRMEKHLTCHIPKHNKKFNLKAQKEIVKKNKPIEVFRQKIKEIKNEVINQNVSLENQYNFNEELLSDILTPTQGNSFYTKKRILEKNWNGDIPIYSSNTKDQGLLIGIKKSKIKSGDLYYKKCMTWSVDGNVGKIFLRNENNDLNKKLKEFLFTANNHCGILTPKVKNLYLPFLKYQLEPIFVALGKGYGREKLGTNQIEDIHVKIPIDSKGNYDVDKQVEIAKKYESVDKGKEIFVEELTSILDKHVLIN